MSDLIDGVLKSSLIDREVPYRILVPVNYSSTEIRYPVLYLLHGLFGSFENWTDLTKLRLYAKDHRLIIAMPDGGEGWYTDAVTGEKYESYFIKEFVPEIDRLFRTVTNRSGRAIAGNSMGGYGAFKFALKYRGNFAYAASFSGAFHAPKLCGPAPGAKWDELGPSVSRVFGKKGSRIRSENDLERIAAGLTTEEKEDLPHFYFDCGSDDEFMMVNRELSRTFLNSAIFHEYHEFRGGHDWQYWDTRIQRLLELVSQKLTFSVPDELV